MARVNRPGMSDEMKADLWLRWWFSESISVISRGIGKPTGPVFTVLKQHGEESLSCHTRTAPEV